MLCISVPEIQWLKLRYEGKKQQLAENDTHSALESLEGKIRNHETNLFNLRYQGSHALRPLFGMY